MTILTLKLLRQKKNKKFIAKKSETYEEEKNVSDKAPVDEIKMNDLSKDATVNEADLLNSINDVKQIEKDLADLQSEYKARKIIVDRFDSIMKEYLEQQKQEQETAAKLNQVMATADKGTPTNSFETNFEPVKKKSNEIILNLPSNFPVVSLPVSACRESNAFEVPSPRIECKSLMSTKPLTSRM